MGIVLFLTLLFALLLIGAPIGLHVSGHALGAMSSSIMLASGIGIAIVCAIILTITKLYVKTKASEAFVRTGMGGLRVIRDGGALVIPVVHELVRVPLGTQRIAVQRQGPDALITSDKLRGDIFAEFFVRIMADDDDIKSAARSLGGLANDRRGGSYEDQIKALIEDKLISALRTSSARKTLEELNSERDQFLKDLTALVTGDLKHNGFTLETVTISKCDQTDEQHLKAGNIFDAQGMRALADITQKNLTEKNLIMRKGEQDRAAQDVDTRKKILDLDKAKAEAEATQAAQVLTIQAEQDQSAKTKQIEAAQKVSIAEVAQQQAIEVARRGQQAAIEVAERDKLKAMTEADQKVEVAKRTQAQAVADAEAKKAAAEAKLADAEADRETSRQKITTVTMVATADREKQKAIIAAEAQAQQTYVAMEKAADGNAYKTLKEADARKASAEADALATTRKAEADKAASIAVSEASQKRMEAEAAGTKAKLLAEADGQRAVAMVPVDVKSREVEIEQRRVNDVLKPELEARAEHGEAAQNFQLAQLRIEQEGLVRIESAKAMAQIYGKITANVYGTPEDVAKMGNSFASGMGLSQMLGGFFSGADPKTVVIADKVVEAVEDLSTAVAGRVRASKEAKDVPPAE